MMIALQHTVVPFVSLTASPVFIVIMLEDIFVCIFSETKLIYMKFGSPVAGHKRVAVYNFCRNRVSGSTSGIEKGHNHFFQ